MKNPRGRMPSPKSGQIQVAWATPKGEKPGLQFCYRGDHNLVRSSNLVMHHFNIAKTLFDNGFIEELQSRGFDMSTFRFSIEMLPVDESEIREADQKP